MDHNERLAAARQRQLGDIERTRLREGALAVFREQHFVSLVRVHQIVAADDGLNCFIVTEPAPGFAALPPRAEAGVRLFASWDILDVGELAWHAAYVPWWIFFEEQLISELQQLAQSLADHGKVLTFMEARAAFGAFFRREFTPIRSGTNEPV